MEIISQADAHARGLKRFFTGVPCQRGHVSQRYVNIHRASGGACVECSLTKRSKTRTERPSRSRPSVKTVGNTAPEAPPLPHQPDKSLHRDPGQRIPQARIDACIDRIYGSAVRLGAAALAASEAA